MSDVWDEVGKLLAERGGPGGGLTSGEQGAIQGLLEDALASPDREGLRRAAEVLEQAFRALLARLPPEARSAAVGGPCEPALRDAYLLGQIGMAQGLASFACQVRTDAAFADETLAGERGAVARALAGGGADLASVAAATGLPETRASEVVRDMIRAGSADFRREAGRTLYFLTPPATVVVRAAMPSGR